MSVSGPSVSFNGSDLATAVPGLRVVSTDPYRFPSRQLNTFPLARREKSVTASAFFLSKKINITVEIGRDTRALLLAAIDLLNAVIGAQEATLQITSGSVVRQWTATVDNVSTTNPDSGFDFAGGLATLVIEFSCSDPIGYDTGTTNLFSETVTTANDAPALVVAGTRNAQPIITITYSALSGGIGASVTIGNPATGQQALITRTWVAGDVLVVDCAAQKITVNGTEVAWSGAIPEWAPGAGTMSYVDTLTTRTRAVVAIYTKRWI